MLVLKQSIQIFNGLGSPIQNDNWTSHLSASLAATIFLAIYLAKYAPDLSTFVGSFPLNAPPPQWAIEPYVSTMIFLPVRPVSPIGPPIINLPFLLIKYLIFFEKRW